MAGLLERFGFAREAEAAYKAFIARNPNEPERVLVLASFLARQDRTKEAVAILETAWKTCRPEAVAATALALYVAPSGRRRPEASGGGMGRRGHPEEPRRGAAAPPQAGRHLLAARPIRRGRGPLPRKSWRSDPDNVETLNNLAWLLALREPGKTQEALELIDRAIEKAGSDLDPGRHPGRRPDPGRRARPGRAGAPRCPGRDPKNLSLALHLAWAYQVGRQDRGGPQGVPAGRGAGTQARDQRSPGTWHHRQTAPAIYASDQRSKANRG